MNHRIVMLMCCVLMSSACAGGDKTMRKEGNFTSKAELDKLQASSVQAPAFKEPPLQLEEWTLAGPLPTHLGLARRAPADEWEQIVAQAVSRHEKLSFTEAGHCISREVGRFYLANSTWPRDALEDFIVNRCGSAAYGIDVRTISFEKTSPAEITTAQIADDLRKDLPGMVEDLKGSGHAELGLWIGQDDKKVVVAVTASARSAEINPIPLRVMDGKLVLEGKLLRDEGDVIVARYTEGDYGAGICAVDTRVALPFFRLTCPLAVADADAIVVIGAGRSDSVFSKGVVSLRFWPGAEPSMVWRSAKVRQILTATPPQPAGAPEQILEQINLVRQAAGLPPHTLSAAQTLTAGKLAGHIFAADQVNDEELQNKIFMGLLAGWDVQGLIVNGNFVAQWAGHTDVSRLLVAMLEGPSGRQALLGKEAGTIAVGALVQDGRVGAVVNVYNFLPEETHSRRIARVQQTIDRIRQLQGSSRIIRDNNLDSVGEKLAQRVSQGKMTLEEAGNELASECVRAWNQNVSGDFLEVRDLNSFSLSATLLAAAKVNAAIMVTTYRPKGYPWAVYGIVVIYPATQAKRVASR
jgi:hypothetical protein